jgi:hypothetical protein
MIPKSHLKKLKGYQLFGFSRYLHHTLESFNRENKCLGALKIYFIEKNSKNTQFAKKHVWFESLEMELLNMFLFKKSKKIKEEQELYYAYFL